jgi:hypothetical protein
VLLCMIYGMDTDYSVWQRTLYLSFVLRTVTRF